MTATGDGQPRIVSVQMLRFVAAFAVLAFHAEIFAYYLGQFRGVNLERPGFLAAGGAGVDLFFAISGFVMVVSMQPVFGRTGARRHFLVRRIVRIVPLYWAATLGLVAWRMRFAVPPDLASTLSALAFIPHPLETAHGRMVPPIEAGWTLNFEMLFYALFAGCLASGVRSTVLRVGAALALGVLAGALLPLPQPLAFWTDPMVLEFAGGMALALVYNAGTRLPVPVRLAMAGAALALILPDHAGLLPDFPAWKRLLTWGVAGWLLLAATVLGPFTLPAPGLWRLGGDISYAVYIVHMPLMEVVQTVWRHFRWPYGPLGEAVFVTGTMAGSLVAGLVLHRWLEKPVGRWLRAVAEPRSG